MSSKSWIAILVLLLAGAGFWYVTASDTATSDAEFAELVHREKQDTAREIKAQSVEETRKREQQAAKEESASEVSIRAAIPELPEFTWQNTRAWNLPLNNPPVVSAADAFFLKPDDYVIGVLLGRHARAYPWFVLANYHAINDMIGSKHVIINMCEACNGGAAFLAKTEQTVLDFRPFGVKNGTWYGIDFQTGSYWYPFKGEAFEGPLKGTRLKRVRTYFSTWREWTRDHPKTTVVLSNDEVRNRPHGLLGHMANDLTFNPELLERLAKSPPNPKLELMPEYEIVFGLVPKADSQARAYSVAKLREAKSPVQTSMGTVPIVLFVQSEFVVGAYVRHHDEEDLELEVVSESPLLMLDQFGNKWNAWGRTESGPHHPAELEVADGYLTKWYEWLENFPDTELINEDLP